MVQKKDPNGGRVVDERLGSLKTAERREMEWNERWSPASASEVRHPGPLRPEEKRERFLRGFLKLC